jgi:hypothetical protein
MMEVTVQYVNPDGTIRTEFDDVAWPTSRVHDALHGRGPGARYERRVAGGTTIVWIRR